MDYTCMFFGILFTAAGLLFACGKGHTHLSAWKAMPQEEKDKIRIGPLCRNIGAMIFLSGSIFLAKGAWPGSESRWFVCAMIVWLITAGFDVWYITKSGRYYNS